MTTRRDQAGSLTLPLPPSRHQPTAVAATMSMSAEANARHQVGECGGNVLLMEARLCEMTCLIRALLRSNEDLNEALQAAPNDGDFLQAVEENKLAVRRQGRVAMALVDEMQAKGCHVQLEEDIQRALLVSGFGVEAATIGSGAAARGADSSNNNNGSTQTSNNNDTNNGVSIPNTEGGQDAPTENSGIFL